MLDLSCLVARLNAIAVQCAAAVSEMNLRVPKGYPRIVSRYRFLLQNSGT